MNKVTVRNYDYSIRKQKYLQGVKALFMQYLQRLYAV